MAADAASAKEGVRRIFGVPVSATAGGQGNLGEVVIDSLHKFAAPEGGDRQQCPLESPVPRVFALPSYAVGANGLGGRLDCMDMQFLQLLQ